jgi:P4 family phage/plasmid primase-like protien
MTAFLFDQARRELEKESAIDPEVIAERGYDSVNRPTSGGKRPRERLKRLHIPGWAIKEDTYFPGLLIPIYGPTGARVSYQWKPRIPATDGDGKRQRYASPRGQKSRLDVHPRNSRVRDGDILSNIQDTTLELWPTEGTKKADSLTSRGIVAISLVGVFGWRSHLGTLGDWEDVPLHDRVVCICYDSDARFRPEVLRAMIRFGRWLKSKGVAKVYYLIVPTEVNDTAVKGVDDFFAAGGTLEQLKAVRTTTVPSVGSADDTYSDARLAETIADDVLADHFIWVTGLGWLSWDGRRWDDATDVQVTEVVRQYVLDQFRAAVEAMKNGQGDKEAITGWHSMLGAGRMRSVLNLARGIVERKADQLDSDLDLLNTPSGVVDLRTGELSSADPTLLMTKITSGSYRPSFTHPDWTKAQEALPPAELEYVQIRIGQGITGHTTPDGVLPVLQGSGENGKSAITTDGCVPALGGYASMASAKLLQAFKGRNTEHSEERATLRGKRLVIAEELTEGLDVTTLKQVMDVGMITARHVYGKNMSFPATHSLFTTTNYIPTVLETDHGTWRRLALVRFPFTFRKSWEPLEIATHRRGDATLKARIRAGADGQHDAIVTWAVEGAIKWFANPETSLAPTKKIADDTLEWRAQADRILGFWGEELWPDPDACVLTTEVLREFNVWLTRNGHKEWSKELFWPRFLQHEKTNHHGAERRRVSTPKGLHLRNAWSAVPPRPEVLLGVRFQKPADKGE